MSGFDLSRVKPMGRDVSEEDVKFPPCPGILDPDTVEGAMAGSTEVGQFLLSSNSVSTWQRSVSVLGLSPSLSQVLGKIRASGGNALSRTCGHSCASASAPHY